MSDSTKTLGFFFILSMTIGTMIGVGILIAPNMLYKFGRYGHYAWPIASFMCLGLAMMFSSLSQLTDKPGPAGFTQAAFGHLPSFQAAWVHWIGFAIAQAVICYSFGQYVGPYISFLTSTQLSLCVLWLTVLISCFLTIFSTGVIMAITALKISILMLFVLYGLPYLKITTIFNLPVIGDLSNSSAFITAMSACLLAFIGMEVGTLPSGNIHNPKVTIPLATLTATLLAAFLYTFCYGVVGSIIDQAGLAISSTPVVDAARICMGNFGAIMLTLLGGIGFFATINGILYGQSFILFHMSKLGIFPRFFQIRTQDGNGFPVNAALFSAAISTILLTWLNHTNLGVFGALSTCFVSISYLWSVIAYRHLGGHILLWILNFITVMAFLFGSLASCTEMIPYVVLMYCVSFLLYGMKINCKNQHNFDTTNK